MAADETATKRFRGETRSTLSCYALRLKPGQEIRECLLNYVKDNNLEAPFVLSCVGSVTQATLRLADASRDTPHEVNQILCICGAITRQGPFFSSRKPIHTIQYCSNQAMIQWLQDCAGGVKLEEKESNLGWQTIPQRRKAREKITQPKHHFFGIGLTEKSGFYFLIRHSWYFLRVEIETRPLTYQYLPSKQW